MAIAPNDPRHPDLTASDVLSPQTWPRRGIRPAVGLDVICTKIAVDFQTMTAATAADCISTNLELLREATRTDAAFHVSSRHRGGDCSPMSRWRAGCWRRVIPSNCAAKAWTRCRGCARGSRRCACRSFAIRLAAAARSGRGCGGVGQPRDRIDSDDRLLSSRAVPAGILGIAGARPRDNWEVQLHLLMKLVGSSLATGLERIEIQAHLRDLGRAQRAGAVQRERRLMGFRHAQQSRVSIAALEGDAGLRRGGRGTGAGLADAGALRRHVARAGRHSRSCRRQDADLRELAPHASCNGRMALGDQPRQGASRRERPLAAPGGRRARHHRAQALRRGAVSREGERADHAAKHRRWRHHHRCQGRDRLFESGGGSAHGLAPRGQPGAGDRGDLSRISRGDLRAARKPARGGDPPHPLDQVGAPHAAHPPRRQRDLCRKHGLAHSRRQRRRIGRRTGVPRRQRGARAQSPAVVPRQPRRAHRPRESPRVRKSDGKGAQEREGARDLLCAVLPRPRPVQDRQRYLRPQRRRRPAGAGRCAAEIESPVARYLGAVGRR